MPFTIRGLTFSFIYHVKITFVVTSLHLMSYYDSSFTKHCLSTFRIYRFVSIIIKMKRLRALTETVEKGLMSYLRCSCLLAFGGVRHTFACMDEIVVVL